MNRFIRLRGLAPAILLWCIGGCDQEHRPPQQLVESGPEVQQLTLSPGHWSPGESGATATFLLQRTAPKSGTSSAPISDEIEVVQLEGDKLTLRYIGEAPLRSRHKVSLAVSGMGGDRYSLELELQPGSGVDPEQVDSPEAQDPELVRLLSLIPKTSDAKGWRAVAREAHLAKGGSHRYLEVIALFSIGRIAEADRVLKGLIHDPPLPVWGKLTEDEWMRFLDTVPGDMGSLERGVVYAAVGRALEKHTELNARHRARLTYDLAVDSLPPGSLFDKVTRWSDLISQSVAPAPIRDTTKGDAPDTPTVESRP